MKISILRFHSGLILSKVEVSNFKLKICRGQSLIELLLTIGLTAIFLPALVTGLVTSREGKSQQIQRIKAVSLLRETQEAIRSIRNRDWSNITENGTFHPVISGSLWASASGSITIDGFTKSYTVGDVNRNTSGAIVEAPEGTLDPSTKRVEIIVSWSEPYASSVTSTLYFTRWRENLAYTETTKAQFNAGTKTGTAVRDTNPPQLPDDGEVILGSGGHSNWCEPSINANTLNLPKNGVGKAVSAIAGASVGQSSQAAAGTGENSSGVSYANVLVSDTYPPVPTIEATFNGHKTNAVFTEQDYSYLATDTNGKQGVIINLNSITDGKYAEAGFLDPQSPGTNAKSIFVLNNYAYMGTTDGKLYIFNITDRSGEHIPATGGSIALAGHGNKVIVQSDGAETYAYVAVNNSNTPLQIVKVTDPSNMSIVGSATVGNNRNGRDVALNAGSTRAYLVTDANTDSGQAEFFTIDISNKNGSRGSMGSYDTGQMDPKGLSLVPGNLSIVVGHGGIEYQVVNISNDSSPVACGSGVDINIDINGVSSVKEADNDAYSYIISDSEPEFRIIEGGPGGGFAYQGIFESQTFDPGYQTADNRFSANFSQPGGTAIQFQVALANQISGICPSTFTFVGQDGTSSSWFPLTPTPGLTSYSAPFPLGSYGPNYSNPGQCFRYKVQMTTTDAGQTPVLYDFTINYSP